MPGSNDGKRSGNKDSRLQKMQNEMASVTPERTWYEYFSQKTWGSWLGSPAVMLYGVGKVAMYFITPKYISDLLNSEATNIVVKSVVDCGAAIIEDWIKFGAEQGGKTIYSQVDKPQGLDEKKEGVQEEVDKLCEAVGHLAALDAVSVKLKAADHNYCDDAYTELAVLERLEKQRQQVIARANDIKAALDTLIQYADGTLKTEFTTTRRTAVRTRVQATIKKGGVGSNGKAIPHWNDNDGFALTYRMYHCSKARCWGPGPQSAD
jgi:hypothetical protein